jgi:exopolysaccharide production protein ExoQ
MSTGMQALPSAPRGGASDVGLGVLSILLIASVLPAMIGGQPVGQPSQNDVTSIQESGDAVRQMIMLALYGTHMALLAWTVRPRAFLLLGFPLMGFMLWCALSTFWSPMPDPTLRRVVAMGGTLAAGLCLGLRLGPAGLVNAMRISAGIVLAGSILHAATSPALAFDHNGYLRGLFSHKNLFGSFMAMAILAVIHHMARGGGSRWSRFADTVLLAGCAVSLAAAHSATPILALLAGIGIFLSAGLASSGRGLVSVAAPAVLGCGAAIILTFGGEIMPLVAEALGRDPSFSGRGTVWAFVAGAIAERPWAGFGYGIFWLGESSPAAVFWHWSRQYELHAHNGYLQLLLDAGAIGTLLFLASLAVLMNRLLALIRAQHGKDGLVGWVAMILGFFLACNLSESRILQGNDLLTLLFVWSVVRVNLECWRVRVAGAIARQDAWQAQAGGWASPHTSLTLQER